MKEKLINMKDVKSREQFEDLVKKGYKIVLDEPYPIAGKKAAPKKKATKKATKKK